MFSQDIDLAHKDLLGPVSLPIYEHLVIVAEQIRSQTILAAIRFGYFCC